MKALRLLLFPFSFLYALAVIVRNGCYRVGMLKSVSFSFPVISVGNLSAGGTGKSPHIEYLVRLLQSERKLVTLSRGYGRKTSGFAEVQVNSVADEVGDEPLQFKKKFPSLPVFVDEKRVRGIRSIQQKYSETDTILLDDAFQHRAIKPGLSVLLTDYSRLYCDDLLLPMGTLRESAKGAVRADVIIITKSPLDISSREKKEISEKLNPGTHQLLCFSGINYGKPLPLSSAVLPLEKITRKHTVILLSGIANPAHLEHYLKARAAKVIPMVYADHHRFGVRDIQDIRNFMDSRKQDKDTIIVTTEKDSMRLNAPAIKEALATLPLYYIPIEIRFCGQDEELFNKRVFEFIKQY